MLKIEIMRSVGEDLVRLLEDCKERDGEVWRFDLAAEVRRKLGMISRQAEADHFNTEQQMAINRGD